MDTKLFISYIKYISSSVQPAYIYRECRNLTPLNFYDENKYITQIYFKNNQSTQPHLGINWTSNPGYNSQVIRNIQPIIGHSLYFLFEGFQFPPLPDGHDKGRNGDVSVFDLLNILQL
jgi:hypothetical protein